MKGILYINSLCVGEVDIKFNMTKPKLNIKAAKDLKKGDQLKSASGKILTVSSKEVNTKRTIVIFDGDIEIDFENYQQLEVI